MVERRWQYALPDDILLHIFDFLPLQDWINFRGVCRSWRIAASCRSNITESFNEGRWCIFYDCDAQDRDMCYFYREGNPKCFSLRLPILHGATCLMSNFGWLLIRRNKDYILFNPLTHAKILLPRYPTQPIESTACQMGVFSALPTSTKCTVFLVSSRDSSTLEVAWCYVADNQWMMKMIDISGDDGDVDNAVSQIYILLGHITLLENNFNDEDYYFHIPFKFVYLDLTNFNKVVEKLVEELQTGQRNEIKYADWYLSRDAHLDNWLLSKFGEEFTISFCIFHGCMTSVSRNASTDPRWIVRGTNAATVNAFIVKAAWIEVAFPVSVKFDAAPLDLEDSPHGYNLRPRTYKDYRGMA